MLELTAKYIGKALVETLDGLSAMKVTMCSSSDVDPRRKSTGVIHVDILGLEEEGIKKISFKLAYDEFEILIERIDGKITLIERENDNKSLIVASGFVFDDKGRKSYKPNEYMAQKFPSVFGKK